MSADSQASVPAGGVNAALFEYGDFLLSRHGKQRALGNHKTETEYLGYSTTAFYFCAPHAGRSPPNPRTPRLRRLSRLLCAQTTCATAWTCRCAWAPRRATRAAGSPAAT